MITLKKYRVAGICIALLAMSLLLIMAKTSLGDVAYQQSGNANNQGLFKNYNFFATSTNQQQLNGSPFYATTTVATGGAANQATSTNIVPWSNINGQIDNGTFVIAGASQVTLMCGREATSTNSGSNTCIYQVESSPNGTWQYFNQLTVVASSTQQSATTNLVTSLTVPTGTSTISGIMGNSSFFAVRCIVNVVTDGAALCSASARF